MWDIIRIVVPDLEQGVEPEELARLTVEDFEAARKLIRLVEGEQRDRTLLRS
jgi:hypothetical protein